MLYNLYQLTGRHAAETSYGIACFLIARDARWFGCLNRELKTSLSQADSGSTCSLTQFSKTRFDALLRCHSSMPSLGSALSKRSIAADASPS